MSRPQTISGFCLCSKTPIWRRRQGFSMSELVICIAILGILALVAILSTTGAFSASQETLAMTRVEQLNTALHTYSTANRELAFPPQEGSVGDEMVILRDLQFRDPNEDIASIGAPYFPNNYNPTGSSSVSEFRLRWNGRGFELLLPGQAGTGLLMVFDGSDFTEPFDFPEGYKSGSR